MTDKTAIEMNVDTFSDGEGYFVRTEIEARSVSISGPFPDLQAAQALKAHRLANREKCPPRSRSNCGAPSRPCRRRPREPAPSRPIYLSRTRAMLRS